MSRLRWTAGAVVLVSALAAAACDSAEETPKTKSWQECQAGDRALVSRAFSAVTGRLPHGQAEINVYEDLVHQLRKQGMDEKSVRTELVRALSRDDAYVLHWADFFLDSLHMRRRVTSSYFGGLNADCFGPVGVPESADLAEYVRDSSPLEPDPSFVNFTVGRLLTSSLLLDDLSPYYRAGLFQLMTAALPGNNVDPLTLEWTRRKVLGETFHETYLNRNLTCLKCHNSEFSITADADPALNRAWPIAGYFERALYGDSEAPGDPMQFHSVFRHSDVVLGSKAPWGWQSKFCQAFNVPSGDDPLGYEVAFGSIQSTPERPLLGKRASIWNLEYALRRGIDSLAQAGALATDPTDPSLITDADEALAYLVALNAAERVWEETMGSQLTIANHFPRTEIARDTLERITNRFLYSHFSLRTLLSEIVSDPLFNLAAPSAGCGSEPYPLPRILDPWTDRESDPQARGNSAGDALYARSPRALVRSLHAVMGWPSPSDFPKGGEGDFQAAIGVFLGPSEPGFRGLSLEARLVWENRYGRCSLATPDFISDLVDRAGGEGAALEETVIALKDRLINEPSIADDERLALESVLGAPLTTPTSSAHEAGLRLACGAYVSSPQFLLAGVPLESKRDVPLLTPETDSYDAVCKTLALRVSGSDAAWSVECSPGTLSVRLN